jgi:hypothetical protein
MSVGGEPVRAEYRWWWSERRRKSADEEFAAELERYAEMTELRHSTNRMVQDMIRAREDLRAAQRDIYTLRTRCQDLGVELYSLRESEEIDYRKLEKRIKELEGLDEWGVKLSS